MGWVGMALRQEATDGWDGVASESLGRSQGPQWPQWQMVDVSEAGRAAGPGSPEDGKGTVFLQRPWWVAGTVLVQRTALLALLCGCCPVASPSSGLWSCSSTWSCFGDTFPACPLLIFLNCS